MSFDQSPASHLPFGPLQPDLLGPSANRAWTWALLWMFALALFAWFIALAGLRPLTLPDEGRYASVAWEMFDQGSWLTPLMDGMPYFHKPPLYYWLSAGSYAVFGASPWAARLPSALAASLAMMGMYVFLRLATTPAIARRSVLVLATMPLFYGAAQFANHDMLVAAFITLTILSGSWALGIGDLPRPRLAAAAAALFAALAVLSKGLIGIALPGLTLLLWAIFSGHWRNLGRLLSPVPLVIFAATAVPWFAVMQHRYPDFLHYFFVYQQFERFTSGGFNNAQPIWFYLPVLAAGCLPWTLMALYSAWRMRRPSARVVRTPTRHERVATIGPQRATREDITRLAWVWTGVMVVFFSIPSSKLIGYILPALPPLAMLLALKSAQWIAPSRPDLPPASPPGAATGWLARLRSGAAPHPGGHAEGSYPWRNWTLGALALCVAMPLVATLVARPATAPLADVLTRQGRPTDVVVAIETYPFDLNLLARRSTPLWVVDNWADPDLPKRDNWRKELFDAAAFAAPGTGEQRLLSRQALESRLCAAPLGSRVWLWARLRMKPNYPVLQQARLAAQNGENGLWLWEKKSGCDAMPASPPQAAQEDRTASMASTSAVVAQPDRWHLLGTRVPPLRDAIIRHLLITQWALRR